MRYVILMLVALMGLSGCASKQGKMDEKRYERQINDAQKSVQNIDD